MYLSIFLSVAPVVCSIISLIVLFCIARGISNVSDHLEDIKKSIDCKNEDDEKNPNKFRIFFNILLTKGVYCAIL